VCAPRIAGLLQLLRYDGSPPFPPETAGLSLHHAFATASATFGPCTPHLDKLRLDDRAIEVERRDARRRGRSEMYAVQTAAGWAERRGEPSEGLLFLGRLVSCPALFEDRKD
jgi:hypothetical protein